MAATELKTAKATASEELLNDCFLIVVKIFIILFYILNYS